MRNQNSFSTEALLDTKSGKVKYHSLTRLAEQGYGEVERFPFSLKVLLEALLRAEDGETVTAEDIAALAGCNPAEVQPASIPFKPARVLLQDFTGVPALVDLAALRSEMARRGKDPSRIDPLLPADLVIDHSVQVDSYASPDSLRINADREFERNEERYRFLHWGKNAFRNFTVVPPASGICHQVNLEYIAKVVQTREIEGAVTAFPDSVIGTDSHTTMVNGAGVLGWGVGGIEAEAALLGQPLFMLIPEVVGVELIGELPSGATTTDLVLAVTETLRKKGVVGKFVEFCGEGLDSMSVPDRATIANMAPEYGATVGFFPVDGNTLEYLRRTGRSEKLVDLVERYCKVQGLFRDSRTPLPVFSDKVKLYLSIVVPSVAGPKRPQDRTSLPDLPYAWRESLTAPLEKRGFNLSPDDLQAEAAVEYPEGGEGKLRHGDVAIAAITSCTNTSNPAVMLAAGLLAKNAVEAGLRVKPYVKTSLAPGSKVVTEYLKNAGLLPYLEELGFHIVGYGCTTCIGNSGPLPAHIVQAVKDKNLVVASVLSGNRNFTGRINPHTKAAYLASPPLVIAFALAGTMDIDLTTEPLGLDSQGDMVYLEDIWPSRNEIESLLPLAQKPELFLSVYEGIERSNERWNAIEGSSEPVFAWDKVSEYIKEPPFFKELNLESLPITPIRNARVLVWGGDSVTTDHISPAGAISPDSPAGRYLISRGVNPPDFNSYGSRRGNHEVIMRGTFANAAFNNLLAPGAVGGFTRHFPSGESMTIYDAAVHYRAEGAPVIILAGADYGMGSSRDWAAKGVFLLGVKAVIARSFERIHRSNLVGMGVLPLTFKEGENPAVLGLTGEEKYNIILDDDLQPGAEVIVEAISSEGSRLNFKVVCRIDSPVEMEYYRNGGVLHTVLRRFL